MFELGGSFLYVKTIHFASLGLGEGTLGTLCLMCHAMFSAAVAVEGLAQEAKGLVSYSGIL